MEGVLGSRRSSSSFSWGGRDSHPRVSGPNPGPRATSGPGLPPRSPPERSLPPTAHLSDSRAPNRIQVAEPPVRRRARRRKPGIRRLRHGILQKLLPARGGLRDVLGRPDSPSARYAPPSSHAPPARPIAREGVLGPPLPLPGSSPLPPAGARRKVAPKSWYLR